MEVVKNEKKTARQPMLMVVVGETGVGKTFRNVITIYQYLMKIPRTGKKARKALMFDVNDDDYPMFHTVSPDHIHKLKSVQARRIRPITPEGKNMTIDEKREVVEKMIHNFKDGLLVTEDLDKYMTGAKGQSIVGLLTTNRHNGLDIMISHQSIAKITTTEWQNCTWLRIHHQVDDISRYENRIPNYFLVRIATFIVDEQYKLANKAWSKGEISEYKYKKQRSFFVYVDMRKLKIQGCSQAAFIRAAKKFIDMEQQKRINMMMDELDANDQPKYASRREATIHLIIEYLEHHQPREENPLPEEQKLAA